MPSTVGPVIWGSSRRKRYGPLFNVLSDIKQETPDVRCQYTHGVLFDMSNTLHLLSIRHSRRPLQQNTQRLWEILFLTYLEYRRPWELSCRS